MVCSYGVGKSVYVMRQRMTKYYYKKPSPFVWCQGLGRIVIVTSTYLIKFQHIRHVGTLSPVNKVYRSKRNIVKMSTTTFVLFALLCGILTCRARHIHPGNIAANLIKLEDVNTDEPINVLHNLKPTRFVPLNTVSFFKLYESCPDGFKRDALGMCREVWD